MEHTRKAERVDWWGPPARVLIKRNTDCVGGYFFLALALPAPLALRMAAWAAARRAIGTR